MLVFLCLNVNSDKERNPLLAKSNFLYLGDKMNFLIKL